MPGSRRREPGPAEGSGRTVAAMTGAGPAWDPDLYARFQAERARPFHDLVARIPEGPVATAADLGCGTGELTRTLLARWPAARVWAVDTSPEMLSRAASGGPEDRLTFVLGDLRHWTPPQPVDRLVSNAALQWVPDHASVLRHWADQLAPAGVLAVQMPNNRDEAAYRILEDLLGTPPWSDRVPPEVLHPPIHPPAVYLEHLASLGFESEAWETTYLHRLSGSEDVLTWLRGTVLRPVLSRLDVEEAGRYCSELGRRLERAYPRGPSGILFPFRRFFFVARKP